MSDLKAIDAGKGVEKKAETKEEKMAEALFIAVGNNKMKVVQKLVENGAKTNWVHGKHTPLRLAAQRGLFPIVRYLHEEAKVSIKDDSRVLHVTVLGDNPQKVMIDYLIASGADVNAEDPTLGTPLMSAMSKGEDAPVVQWLLAKGAKRGQVSPLHEAVKKGDIAGARGLLASGGKELLKAKDAHGMVPLMCAAESGGNDLVSLFLENGASANDESCGFTPLFLAVQNDHLSTVKILVEAKADVNVSDSTRGAFPLHLAASNNYLDMMKFLFEHKAEANCADNNGLSPLHMAVSEGLTTAVRVLLNNHADVHMKDGEGRTTIMHAIMGNHPWTAALLLQHGADPNMKDNDDIGPIDVIKEHSLAHMAQVFQRYGDIDVDNKKTACGACMKAMETFKRCSRCKQLWYCSVECQRLHWGHHKQTCKKV